MGNNGLSGEQNHAYLQTYDCFRVQGWSIDSALMNDRPRMLVFLYRFGGPYMSMLLCVC